MQNWKKTFLIIWSGQIFSTLSSVTVSYAMIFWLSIETKSAEVLALATIASMLPQMLLGPFIGVLIDRLNRRMVMIFADLFIAGCSVIIAVMFMNGIDGIHWFYVLMMLRSIGSAFHIPAMQASTPLLAPESELIRISGVNQMIQSSSIIVGPMLAALLISNLEMSYVLFLDVVGAVIASVSLLMVHIPNPEKKENAPEPHVMREMKEGFMAIYNHKGLYMLFIISVLATFFIMPIAALFPLMTINHFMGSTYQVSLIEVSWGVGMLFGGLLLGIKSFKVNEVIMINLTYVILGLTFAFTGILPANAFWMFMVLTFFGGISMTLYSGVFMVILQTSIDPAAMGRVFSLFGSITLLPSIIGLVFTGYIADTIGVPNSFLIAGISITILGIYSFFPAAIKQMIRQRNASGIAPPK